MIPFYFADSEIFVGPIGVWADEQVSVIPDFIANGRLHPVFFYLMSDKVEITDQAIFSDVSNTIKNALKKTFEVNPGKTKLSQNSYEIALSQLM